MTEDERWLINQAEELAAAEKAQTEEYLMLMAAGKVSSYQAQRQAEHPHGTAVRLATAYYEIALARLRKG